MINEIEIAEQKLCDVAVELVKQTKRNVHIEINAEHQSECVKIKSEFSKTFKNK